MRRGGVIVGLLLAASLLADTWAAPPPCDGATPGAFSQLASITTLYRRIKSWSDYSEPVAVVQLEQAARSLHFVAGPRDVALPRFLAVGDAAGGLHLLSPSGRPVAQHHTGTPSPVTALGSFRLSRNSTVVLTGHDNGEVRLHLLLQPQQAQQRGRQDDSWEETEGWEQGGPGSVGSASGIQLSLLQALPPEAVLCGGSADAAAPSQQPAATCSAGAAAAAEGQGQAVPQGCAPITLFAALGSRGGSKVAARVVVTDGLGRLAVMKHGGAADEGAYVIRRVSLGQQALALRLAGSKAAVLGSSGMSSQKLSPPPEAQAQASAGSAGSAVHSPADPAVPAPKLPHQLQGSCRGLNGSQLVAAVFDAHASSRAYALTSDGRMLALAVGGGERGGPTGCTVRAAAQLPPGLMPSNGQVGAAAGADAQQEKQQQQQVQPAALVHMAAMPGYLLVTAGDSLAVFNASSAPRSPPRLLLLQPLSALRERFGVGVLPALPVRPTPPIESEQGIHQQEAPAAGEQEQQQEREGSTASPSPAARPQLAVPPLLAASKQGHVALMLNASVLAVYETVFPFRPGPQPNKAGMAWLQLFQPLAMLLVAAVVIYRARALRGGGGGGGGSSGGRRGGSALSADARLREFERLLRDPLAGATATRRNRPAPGGWQDHGHGLGGSSSGSEADDSSLLGMLPPGGGGRMGGSGGGAATKRRTNGAAGGGGGLFGGGSGGGGSRERCARSRRAAAMAASDDREIADMAAQYRGTAGAQAAAAGVLGLGAGGGGNGGALSDSSDGEGMGMDMDLGGRNMMDMMDMGIGGLRMGAGTGAGAGVGMPAAGFGSELELMGGGSPVAKGSGGGGSSRRGSEELSQLRHRFGHFGVS